MPVVPDTFADNPAGNTPITAAKLNNIENAIVADDATNSASASAIFTAGRYATIAGTVPKWAPSTVYAVGNMVVSPGGGNVTANVAHTSGTTFTASNWNLSNTFAQSAEGVYAPMITAVPATVGNEPWQVLLDSFYNNYGPAGTYNHAVHLGWNASRHNGGTSVAGKAAILMGFEDNYYAGASGESQKYGTEWYVEYWSPDGTSQTMLRPFYARMEGSNTNTANNMTITHDIGSDGSGEFMVKAQGMGALAPLLVINPTTITLYKDTTVQAPNFAVQVTTGQAIFAIDSPSPPTMAFRISGTPVWTWQAGSSSAFTLYDTSSRANLTFTYGATAAAARLEIGSAVTVDGTIAAGASSGAPTVAATANLGTTPPAIVLTAGSNTVRGRIEVGTGTTPAAGTAAIMTFPTAYANPPRVMLVAENFATSALAVYVDGVSTTGFQIAFGTTPAASQAASTYKVSYLVIG